MKAKNKLFIILIVFCLVVMMSCSIAIVFAASENGIDVNPGNASFTYTGKAELNGLDTDGDGEIDSYEITGWEGTGEVVIPDFYNGLPIIQIGKSAFYNCVGITKITLGANVVAIGDNAFEDFGEDLTELHLNPLYKGEEGEGGVLQYIGFSAFYSANSLKIYDHLGNEMTVRDIFQDGYYENEWEIFDEFGEVYDDYSEVLSESDLDTPLGEYIYENPTLGFKSYYY